MIELRKDYILDRWSYIALDRENRVRQFRENGEEKVEGECFFCPGNESLTPQEAGRLEKDGKWQIRWFPNKFPITEASNTDKIAETGNFLVRGGAFGYHEIIVENPDHQKQLWDLGLGELSNLFKTYSDRIENLSSRQGVKYVQLFKNSGQEAGTSLVHTHTQIVATSIIPKSIGDKIIATKKYASCPYCDIIKIEEKSDRFIYSNDDFIVFAPFAPRFNYETCIFPKKHLKNLSEINERGFENLAMAFQKILIKLENMNSPYNFFLHYAPHGENLHFHFEITPRMNKWAGFELATDSYVVTTSPENAAKYFKK